MTTQEVDPGTSTAGIVWATGGKSLVASPLPEFGAQTGKQGHRYAYATQSAFARISQDITRPTRQDEPPNGRFFFWSCDQYLRLAALDDTFANQLELPPSAIRGLPLLALTQGALALTPSDLKQQSQSTALGDWDGTLLAQALNSKRAFDDVCFALRGGGDQPLFGVLSGQPCYHTEDGRFLGYQGKGQLDDQPITKSVDKGMAPHIYSDLRPFGLSPEEQRPLKDLAQELEVAVLENAQLRYLVQKLQDSNREELTQAQEFQQASKAAALSRLAHELRSPLNAIQGYSELILSAPPGKLPENYTRYLETVLSATHHLDDLVSSLEVKSESPHDSQEASLELVPIDLKDVMDELIGLTKLQAHKAQIDARALRLDRSFWVLSHRRSLIQILLNLITNAIKFTPADGKIGLDVQPRGQDDLVVTVWDTGRGIAAEEQDKIFTDGFRSLADQPGEPVPGQGLGLAIVTDLLTKLGLKINVDSAPDSGSRFTFLLPLASDSSMTQGALSQDEKSALSSGQEQTDKDNKVARSSNT